jgi:hypothetical protein
MSKVSKTNPYGLYFSTGNSKLKSNENTAFLIWNLPAVKTCPYRTAQCEKSCYARKAERLYPSVLPCRENNLELSKRKDFSGLVVDALHPFVVRNAGKTVVVRIHESGDFYSLNYFGKWVAVAKWFEMEGYRNVVFLAYTKSIPMVLKCGYGNDTFPKNFVIRSSIWDDTAPERIWETDFYSMPIYTAFPKNQLAEKVASGKYTECRCSDCATCGKCWDKTVKNIAVAIH